MAQLLGAFGMVVAMFAYLPQIVILARTRSSTDISLRSWQLSFAANLLIMLSAFAGGNVVFEVFSVMNASFIGLTTLLILLTRRPLMPGTPFGVRGARSFAERLVGRTRRLIGRRKAPDLPVSGAGPGV